MEEGESEEGEKEEAEGQGEESQPARETLLQVYVPVKYYPHTSRD